MTTAPPRDRGGLAAPATISALLHAILLTAFVTMRPVPPPPSPPVYRVNLVAAPPGERATGVVRPPAPIPPVTRAPTPSRPVTSAPDVAPAPRNARRDLPRRTPPQATPTPEPVRPAARPDPATPAPTAGGGPVGGRGADVATVRTEGIEFPYPGYLDNIVRQIARRFTPPRGSTARAEVTFLIHRDGSVSNFRFLVSSRSYAFDVEARGAVESAAEARAFGPLPRGFPDDVLPVIFSFDPRLIR